jgi:DNA integrity scanning protein DisA with diadenylate cyclase activity
MATAENIFNKFNEFIRDVRNDEIKSIVFGLFALIGFIILVYSIFTGIIREPLASVADTVFVAVIIGFFTLVGIIIGKRLLNK